LGSPRCVGHARSQPRATGGAAAGTLERRGGRQWPTPRPRPARKRAPGAAGNTACRRVDLGGAAISGGVKILAG
jgi:hypothetical protein